MYYRVKFSQSALKELKKLDKQTARLIKNWVVKNLVDTKDPKVHGKEFKGFWRYRLGDYRMFAEFKDEELIILVFESTQRLGLPSGNYTKY